MRKKICVIGKGVKLAHDFAQVGDDLRGADVVVLAGDADLEEVKTKAPAAALLVLDGAARCQAVYEETLVPRSRVIGVDADQLHAVVDAVVAERDQEFEVLALADGEFSRRRAIIGRRGITALSR